MADYRIHTKEQAIRIADLVRALNVEGKQWVVTIKKYQKQRSLPANNLYWKWLTIIGNELGSTKDEMHDIFREKFLPWEEIEKCGVKVKILTSTSAETFSVAMMGEYMTQIDRFAAQDMAILLPHPEDDFYSELQR